MLENLYYFLKKIS
jgi:hypothetical protein